MEWQFYKYHGAGNDFVMIDDRAEKFPLDDTELVRNICTRHTGVGADGLILLRNAEGFDFRMIYYNADGNESTMCGNGGRCILLFAQKLGIIKDQGSFIAIDGPHEGYIEPSKKDGQAIVHLKMSDVPTPKKDGDAWVLNTGSPHYVSFMPNTVEFESLAVKEAGAAIRYSPTYANGGINVNFVLPNSKDIQVKTYERGVEDETLACGTGVVACAIASYADRQLTDDAYEQQVQAVGGSFRVSYEKDENGFRNVWLIGPATEVFHGVINMDSLK